MNLDAINIPAGPGETESLALAVRGLLAAGGTAADYTDLCGAMGLCFASAASVFEPSPATWSDCGRDAFLERTARAFGLSLRNLHPPDVGVDMLAAEEYPQHFELSYKPLIRRALENAQPVIAWRGWEGDAGPLWGVITAQAGEDFAGTTPLDEGGRRLLNRPALQCYVVERCEPRRPAPAELLRLAIEHGAAGLDNQAGTGGAARGLPGVVTGFEAIEQWRRAFLIDTAEGVISDAALKAHQHYAAAVSRGRLAAVEFLGRHRSSAGPENAGRIDEAAMFCAYAAGQLARWFEETPAETLMLMGAAGLKVMLSAIEAAKVCDLRLAGIFRAWRQGSG